MTEQEILKYCHFYKGEAMIPQSIDHQKYGVELWVAEKMICEYFSNMIDRNNPRKKIAELIAAYVGKWAPFEFRSIMKIYFDKVPDLEKEIMQIYS